MGTSIKLGLLDFGTRKTKYSSMGKVLEVMEYAKEADSLGFTRFWLSEHHNFSSSEAWSSPQMILPLILNETDEIHVGMAGVLLNYYSSYEVAMNFKMLANLFPQRVDLGFAAGTPPLRVSQWLSQQNFKERPNTIANKVTELYRFFHEEESVAHEFKVTVPPYKGLVPEMFMLSNSFNRIEEAVEKRLHISKSIFHREDSLFYQRDNIYKYQEAFHKAHGQLPQVSVAFTGVCADTEMEARKLAAESGYRNFHNGIIGTPEMFLEVLHEHSRNFAVDEFIFHDATAVNEKRIESLYALSAAFSLNHEKLISHEV